MQAAEHCLFRFLDGPLVRETPGDYGLHQCKDVLGAVVYFMRQEFLPLLRQLSFRNVPGNLGRSNDLDPTHP